MKYLLLSSILLASLPAFTQKYERYYDYDWNPTFNNMARFYSLVQKKDSVWERNDYFFMKEVCRCMAFIKMIHAKLLPASLNIIIPTAI